MRWLFAALIAVWSFGAQACVQIVSPDGVYSFTGTITFHKTSRAINSAFPGVIQIDRRGHAYKTVSYTLMTMMKDVCVLEDGLGHEPTFPQVAMQIVLTKDELFLDGQQYTILAQVKNGNVLMHLTPYILKIQKVFKGDRP